MATETIQVGDRVINLQVPGIFAVVDREGEMLVIQTARGLRMTVKEPGLRRVDGSHAPPSDA
jgi:hypothetical protein